MRLVMQTTTVMCATPTGPVPNTCGAMITSTMSLSCLDITTAPVSRAVAVRFLCTLLKLWRTADLRQQLDASHCDRVIFEPYWARSTSAAMFGSSAELHSSATVRADAPAQKKGPVETGPVERNRKRQSTGGFATGDRCRCRIRDRLRGRSRPCRDLRIPALRLDAAPS